MNKLSALFLIFCGCLFVGCGGEPWTEPRVTDHVAYAQRLADGTFEVRLRYHQKISGGPCLSDGFFTSTVVHDQDWLYVKSLEGTWPADKIIVKQGGIDDQGGGVTLDTRKPIKGIRGTVAFNKSTLVVNLEWPNYPDGENMKGYEPYDLNGTYEITTTDTLPTQMAKPAGEQARQ